MSIRTVGLNCEFETIAAALVAADPNDTILLESGYANETVTVTKGGLIIEGDETSTGIVLHLARGISSVNLAGSAPITLLDASDANAIVGNAGSNRITVTDGADSVDGGLGIDRLVVDYSLSTGAVTGTLSSVAEAGGTRLVTITAGTFEHLTILTGSGADTITTGAGDDIIHTGEGAGTVTAGQGYNVITGGSGADTITASDGGNVVRAGDGANIITTGAGVDRIWTGVGSDTISAGGGDDVIYLLGGSDTVHGEGGSDRLVVDYSATLTSVTMNAPGGTLAGYTGNVADLGVNTASFDGMEHFTVTGGAAGDFLTSGAGNDVLSGGAGNDRLFGGDGLDVLNGGAGADLLDGGRGADLMRGGAGDDVYMVRDAGDIVDETGGGGRDAVKAFVDYTLTAGVENLTMAGGGRGTGNALNNAINGSGLNETLQGMGGNDTLVGGGGRDVLTGGSGRDVFVFSALSDSVTATSRSDRITDFSSAEGDTIYLVGLDADSRSAGTNDAFTFIGASGFTAGTAGQVRAFYNAASGVTVVQGETNGDGVADFQILLECTGALNLSAGDFLL
jgi:Ca2+-binding RTX toxin-like protein